jgi:CRISPR-associated endonuclease/helicase Cas3
MAVTIRRHGVPSDSETKLSPLQTELLYSPKRVRMASAPTGAGKSYAFQRAMIDNQARILFIVPTRRLAQNLKLSVINTLQKEAGWDQVKANHKVTVWSSDTTDALKKADKVGKDKISITGFRIREIYELDETREGGEMIFTTPEVVSGILLRGDFLKLGQADTGVIDLLSQFDHIVFDEFHTIEARGFGMAAVFAKLAAELQQRCRAKISFLSATALDIKPVLLKLNVPKEQIDVLTETVTDECSPLIRPIHGDVQLAFAQQETLAELIADYRDEIRAEIAAGRLVVAIYNNLGHLQRQRTDLAATLEQLGVSHDKRLLINSIDDSHQSAAAEFEADFTVGRDKEPTDFQVLIATSSVEMGVTFNTRLLLMEPCFEPLNFLQRYGRAT